MPLQTLPCALDSQTSRQTRQTHEAVSLAVARARRILVLTGAGISVSSGIPDFRSAHGLYALNKSSGPAAASSGPSPASGKDLFDAGLFRDPASAARFYAFIAGLKRRVDDAQPSPTHHFLHTLGAKSKLLRCYTQNIDDLESRLDPPKRPSEPLVRPGPDMLSSQGSQATDENAVPSQTTTSSQTSTDSQPTKYRKKAAVDQPKFVQLHGNLHRVRCRLCSWADDVSSEHLKAFEEGDAPDCPDCSLRCSFQVILRNSLILISVNEGLSRTILGKRPIAVGTIRPAIVLYNENHPHGEAIAKLQNIDLHKKPDLLIIMGTSLKVHGFKEVVKSFAGAVHTSKPAKSSNAKSTPILPSNTIVLYVNATEPAAEWNGIIDYHLQGTTDDWCEEVLKVWKKRIPSDWEIQSTLSFKNSTIIKQGVKQESVKDKAPVEERLPLRPRRTRNWHVN